VEKIRLLLIEDNRLLRDSLTAILRKQRGLNVVAAVESTKHALHKAQESKPHVILLGLDFHAAEALRKQVPEAKMIVMNFMPLQEDVLEFIRLEVSGFILKDATLRDFLKTVRSVARGNKVLPPSLTDSLFSQVVEHAGRMGGAQLSESVRMTGREREIIEVIAEGLSNKEIAQRLHIAVHTVKSHIHNILEKLALHTRLEIATYAHSKGISKSSRS